MKLATLIRIELLAAVAIICVAATRQGMNLSDPWLSEAMIVVTLISVCAWAILIARALIGGVIGWMLSWGAIWLAASIAGALLSFRATLLPQGSFYTLTAADAVNVEMEVRGGSEIWVTVTNQRDDWLRNAIVTCTLHFDNGDPIPRAYRYGVANGYMARGEEVAKRVISRLEVAQRRADPFRTICSLAEAQFMESSNERLSVGLNYDRTHKRHIFTIRNDGDNTVTDILVQCRDGNGHNRQMLTVGRWSDDPRAAPVIEPGSTTQLTTRERSFAKLGDCVVLSLRKIG